MLFLFKSTPENKKRKHSEHFSRPKEPGGSQRASRTYCALCERGRRSASGSPIYLLLLSCVSPCPILCRTVECGHKERVGGKCQSGQITMSPHVQYTMLLCTAFSLELREQSTSTTYINVYVGRQSQQRMYLSKLLNVFVQITNYRFIIIV